MIGFGWMCGVCAVFFKLQPFMLMKVKFKSLLVCMLMLVSLVASAQEISVIPVPVKLERKEGAFEITSATVINSSEKAAGVVAYFKSAIQPATGFSLQTKQGAAANGINFFINDNNDAAIGNEGYTLEVSPTVVTVKANTAAGAFYGAQTLLQLLPKEIAGPSSKTKWIIPSVKIVDYPRFAWRGIMFDVSRHFFSKQYVKEYIDRLARYKFNRLHWHLTDDNGWRIEIKSLPKLTQVGAWRVERTGTFGTHDAPKPGEPATYGGFYTQDDIREIVQYAKERFIEILPEVDVPGHSMAALAAYPDLSVSKDTSVRVNPGSKYSTWFGNGKFEMHIDNTLNPTDEKVYQFLDKVFTEVAELFPFEYIHMGGDECYKGFWERNANVQAFMKKNNIKNGEELQIYFAKRVTQIITSKKKKVIGWDEILEGGVVEGSAVMSWRGVKGGIEASHKKLPVVMSPAPDYYIDMMQGDPSIEAHVYGTSRLKSLYNFNILPKEIDSTYVIGGQANLWTEQIVNEPQVEYMMFPRTFAVSESLWSPKSRRNYDNFSKRVEKQFERFDLAGINYARAMYDPIISVKKNNKGKMVIELSAEAPDIDFYYTLDNTIPNYYYEKYKAPIVLPDGTDMIRITSYQGKTQMGRLISLSYEDLAKRVRK